MLQVVGIPQAIQTAQGKKHTVCCRFKSDVSLTGKVIKLNLLKYNFTSTTRTDLYQSTYATGLMVYVGNNPSNKQAGVTLDVIDQYNFEVCVAFYATKNLNNWLTDAAQINSEALSVAGGTNRYFAMFVDADGSQAESFVPFNMKSVCEDSELVIDVGNGFTVGENLEVTLSNPNPVSFQYYAGFYSEHTITNQKDLVTDSLLQYATIGDGLGFTTLITAGTGFTNASGGNQATLTIDSSAFESGGRYRLYIVYKENGIWKSCITPPIEEIPGSYPIVSGDITCELKDVNGATHSGYCCFTNVSPCGRVEVSVTMDATTYNAALAALGLTGDIFSNFLGSSATLNGNSLISSHSTSGSDLKVTAAIKDESLKGKKELRLTFIFSVGGQVQKIIVPISVSFNNSVTGITKTILDESGDPVVDVICAEGEGVVSFTVNSGEVAHLMTDGIVIDSDALTQNGIDVDIDTSLLEIDKEYCIKIITAATPTASDCECPECPDKQVLIFASTGAGLQIAAQYSGGTITLTEEISGTTNTASDSVVITITDQPFYQFTIEITDTDTSCEYIASYSTSLNPDSLYRLLELSKVTTNEDCTCPPEVDCTHNPTLSWNCDPATGQISGITAGGTFGEATLTDTLTDEDGNPISGTYQDSVYVKREVTFANCDPLRIEELIECLPEISCVNNRTLGDSINASCELVISIVDSFESTKIADTLNIRHNGTLYTYDQMTSPYGDDLVVSDGDTIEYWSQVVFDGSCPDLIDTVVTFTVAETQGNSRGITLAIVDNKLEVTISDTFVDSISEDTLYIEKNGNIQSYDQVSEAYNDNLAAVEGDTFNVWSVTTFTKVCTPTLTTAKVYKAVLFADTDCTWSANVVRNAANLLSVQNVTAVSHTTEWFKVEDGNTEVSVGTGDTYSATAGALYIARITGDGCDKDFLFLILPQDLADPNADDYHFFNNVTAADQAITNFTLPNPAIHTADEINNMLAVFRNGIKQVFNATPSAINEYDIDISTNKIVPFVAYSSDDIETFIR